MRVVLDTNVVASALLWGGTPERLIRAAVLACALAARADAIVSGDEDLLALGCYQGIPVLTPAACLRTINP